MYCQDLTKTTSMESFTMYDKLVVAVDGSNTSLNALKHAANLAHMTNAKLVVVTIVNPTEFMAVAPEFLVDENYESAAIQQGEAVLDQAVAD